MRTSGDPTAQTADAPRQPHLFHGALTGIFQHIFGSDTIEWSDEVYEIHGYQRGEVVPTFALGSSHVVAEQREDTALFWAEIGDGIGPQSIYLHLIDAKGKARQVLATGDQLRDTRGEAVGVWGLLIDLTRSIHVDSHRRADEAVAASAAKRGVIEQAKGVLAGRHNITTAEAYALLNHHSQNINRQVKTVAQDIVDAVEARNQDHDHDVALAAATNFLQRLHGSPAAPPSPRGE